MKDRLNTLEKPTLDRVKKKTLVGAKFRGLNFPIVTQRNHEFASLRLD